MSVQERWFSNGVFGTQYVVCDAGDCPASTTNNPTINTNTMKGATYIDLSGTYNLGKHAVAYFKIDNLMNVDPVPSPQTNTGLDVNPALYDTLGRFYHAGVRFRF